MAEKKFGAADVARLLVLTAAKEDRPISSLQLQKVLYFVQRDWMNEHNGNPLFDDDFVAWQYGPVIKDVYHFYSVYSGMEIKNLVMADSYAGIYGRKGGDEKIIPADVAEKIVRLAEPYMSMQPWDLVAKSHERGGAWYSVYADGKGYGLRIPKSLIADR